MCTLYNVTTNHEAMRRMFGVDSPRLANLPPFGDIYPGREGSIVRTDADGRREAAALVWGFPPPPGARDPVINIRNLASPFWRAWTKPAQRCLVPVERFSEWSQAPDPRTGRKRKVWFALKSGEPFAFAGLWRPAPAPAAGGRGAPAPPAPAQGDLLSPAPHPAPAPLPPEPGRYAFLTCMSNSLVASVHPKAMPVILAPADYDRWLTAPWAEAAPLARAYPAEAMTILDDA